MSTAMVHLLVTVDNPGEAFSFFAPQNVFAQNPATNPGQQVKAQCNPTQVEE